VLPQLTRKRRQLARVLLDTPCAAAFRSAEDLGGHAGVDAATVVRCSRVLGYAGFSDLKRALQSDVPPFLSATDKVRQELIPAENADRLLELSIGQDAMNFERAALINEATALRDAINLIDGNELTLVLAAGISASVGHLLAHLLRLIGLPAVHREAEVPAAVEIAHLTPSQAVVGIAFRRYMHSTVRLFSEAARRTQARVAITDSKASPLACLARVALLAPTDAAELTNSITAPIAVVNALVTGLTLLNPQRAVGHLAELDRIFLSAAIAPD
jgi:DNA-binding MurR/RpiR family transcriptional regulator